MKFINTTIRSDLPICVNINAIVYFEPYPQDKKSTIIKFANRHGLIIEMSYDKLLKIMQENIV